MMQEQIDLQNMPDADIAALAARCLECISIDERIVAVLRTFHSAEDLEELKVAVEDAIEADAAEIEDEPEEE